jgi:IclR family mhp operon transcriptional activator
MKKKSDYIRALGRGLKVLKFINGTGEVRASEIARGLNLPRPTVYRILQTLEEDGYILMSSSDARVRVTALAASLGDNASSHSQLCTVSAPILFQFTTDYSWPIDLSVYYDLYMVIQETTHARSTLSIDRNMSGFRLPMLRSSAGRAYLGSCGEVDRNVILKLLSINAIIEDRHFLQQSSIEKYILSVQELGYAVRDSFTLGATNPKTATISVPVFTSSGVVGCVSTIWLSDAMSMDNAVDHFSEKLLSVARKISDEMLEAKKPEYK